MSLLVGCGGERHPEAAGARTWEIDGLLGRVRSVTEIVPADSGRADSARLISRMLYDTVGRAREFVAFRREAGYLATSFRYDSLGRLLEEIALPVEVQGTSVRYTTDADSLITTVTYHLDAEGRCVERIDSTHTADRPPVLRYEYGYDRSGNVITDSVFDEQGKLNWYTTYDRHLLGGWTASVHAGSLGRPRLLNEYDYTGDRHIARSRFYFDDSSRTEIEFTNGRETSLRSFVHGTVSVGRYEYLDDAHGNWIRCRFLRKEGEEWRLDWERRRTIVYW